MKYGGRILATNHPTQEIPRNLAVRYCVRYSPEGTVHLNNISQQHFFGHCAAYYRSPANLQATRNFVLTQNRQPIRSFQRLYPSKLPRTNFANVVACTDFIIMINRRSETKRRSITDKIGESYFFFFKYRDAVSGERTEQWHLVTFLKNEQIYSQIVNIVVKIIFSFPQLTLVEQSKFRPSNFFNANFLFR